MEISHFPLYKTEKDCYNSLADAPVAQWIEHQIPVLRVGGSSPFRRTKQKRGYPNGYPLFCSLRGGTRRCEMQIPGGHLPPPVQTLVATLQFAFGKLKRVPSGVFRIFAE